MATSSKAPPRLSIAGIALAALALLMLAIAWGEMLDPPSHARFGIVLGDTGGGPYVASVEPGTAADRAGVKVGDAVDLSPLSLSERFRLEMGSPLGTQMVVRVEHAGVWRNVTLTAQIEPSPDGVSNWWPLVAGATVTLLIVAFIAFRRPSIGTAALVLYGCGAITTFTASSEFSWLSDPWFGIVAVTLNTVCATLPLFALPVFIVRFPHEPASRAGIVRKRFADVTFVALAIVFAIETIFEPVLYISWSGYYNALQILGAVAILVLALLAYRDEKGESRRRIAWVIAGYLVSVAAYAAFNVIDGAAIITPSPAYTVALAVLQLMQTALPIALAYAILKHRVLDIGFALNRSVVYAVLTTIVVCVVSLVDWLTTRLLSEERLALAVEALATIAVGVSLNRLHSRVERVVDRTVFRQRHIAERRIDHRIDALAFAAGESTIDEALASDAADIIGLSSAAVFRRPGDGGSFERVAAYGWQASDATALEADSLLVRTMRAVERPVMLADLAVTHPDMPGGHAAPVLAIPISTQHELLGVALYGNERDGGLPDPSEVSLLARLVGAASTAYGVVEARRWRRRASELEGSLRLATES